MKKDYICPTVLIVNVEKDVILADSQSKVTPFALNPSSNTSSEESDPARWADAKGGHGGFNLDDDFSDDIDW